MLSFGDLEIDPMIFRLSVVILFLILGFEYMITMRTKSPWGLHVPSVETQMMPAFSWVQQTVVLSSKITFESLACDPW